MLLAVDIGNTNIVFGIYEDDVLIDVFRIETLRERKADEYSKILGAIFRKKNIQYDLINSVTICSVVPQTKNEFENFCKSNFSANILDVGDNILNLGISIDIEKPYETGADRVVNAIAFYNKYKSAGIIIDFGTATTFDVVNEDGSYIGGMISPGVNLAISALANAAAKLPEIKLKKPESAIGKTTIHAMQAGVYYGYLGLIESSVKEITSELAANGIKGDIKVIATGGLAGFFKDSPVIEAVEENLTLNGLLLINQRKKSN